MISHRDGIEFDGQLIENDGEMKENLQQNGSKRVRKTTTDQISDAVPLVCGRLVSVEVENFMCHVHLVVPFNADKSSNCVYIGGPNGSGKSALFAAINIGLGGRGNTNDRGNSVSCYIKHGQTRARIRLVLTNKGAEAMDPLTYGDQIAIERVITASSSSYTIKAIFTDRNTEHVVSHKKSDLDRILEKFYIELHNPIYWLSQDRARQFLQDMKPSKLYELFDQASQLQTMRIGYDKIRENINECQAQIPIISKRHQSLAKIKEKLRERQQQHVKVLRDRENLAIFGFLLLWCPVRDANEKCEVLMKQIERIDKNVTKMTDDIEQEDEKRKLLMDAEKEKKEEIDAVKKEARMFEEKREILFKQRQISKRNCEQCMQNVNEQNENVVKEQSDIQNLTKQIDILRRAANSSQSQESIENLQNHLASVIQEKNTMLNTLETAKHDHRQLQNACEELAVECNSIRNTIQSLEFNKRQCVQAKDLHYAATKDALAKYGAGIPQLLTFIQQQKHLFSHVPIGPIGHYMKVKDSKWSAAIEKSIGRVTMHSFVCDNNRDSTTLKSLMKQMGMRQPPPILTRKFIDRRFDTKLNEPPCELTTVARQIDVSNVAVENILIDLCSIESLLLIEEDEDAREMMQREPPIKNVTKAYTLALTVLFPRGPRSTYRSYVHIANQYDSNQISLLSTNLPPLEHYDERIRNIDQQINDKKITLNKMETQRREAETRVQANTVHRQQCNSRLPELDRREIDLNSQINKLQTELSESNLQAFITELEIRKQRLQPMIEMQIELQNTLSIAKQQLRTHMQAENELKNEQNTFLKRMEVLEAEVRKRQDQIDDFDRAGSAGERRARIDKLNDIRKKKEEELIQYRNEAEQARLEAMNLIHEVPDGWTNPPDFTRIDKTKSLRDKFIELEVRVQLAQTQLSDVQADSLAYIRTKQEYFELKCQFDDFKSIITMLNECMQTRQMRYVVIRAETAMHLQERFHNLMSIRQYGAKTIIDHEDRSICIEVDTSRAMKGLADTDNATPAKRLKRSKIQDLKSLSGGERSYTTACFIMSLWDATEAPFRCMDEFDVFMDMVNRQIVMDLLVGLATKQFPGYQFIFFTPQGLEELGNRNDVQVFTMPKARP